MMTNKQIKVIKREERNAARPVSVNKKQPETKRDAVTIVSEWVRELRQKKDAEALQGFEGLFETAA